jgi:hypothetical protein
MNYLSVEQIELRASEQLRIAAQLPLGNERSDAIKCATELRSYAAMKRLLLSPRQLTLSERIRSELDN